MLVKVPAVVVVMSMRVNVEDEEGKSKDLFPDLDEVECSTSCPSSCAIVAHKVGKAFSVKADEGSHVGDGANRGFE
jgi:hypothetical protein